VKRKWGLDNRLHLQSELRRNCSIIIQKYNPLSRHQNSAFQSFPLTNH